MEQIDKSELENRLFDGFAAASDRNYIYICNMKTGVSRWDKKAVEYFGLPGEYMKNAGSVWEEHIHPDDREAYRKDIDEVFSGKKVTHMMDYRAENLEGEYVLCTCRGVVMRGNDDEADIFVGSIVNHSISDNVDAVTNLYNVYGFRQYFRFFQESRKKGSILLVGINNFSEINDIYGYQVGDHVLRVFGEKLVKEMSEYGPVYRMDGVRFSCCLQEESEAKISAIYEKIKRMAGHDIFLDGERIAITVSGGVVIMNSNYDESSVVTSARYSLEQSKHEKHGELVFFNDSLLADNRKNLELMGALRKSILNDFDGFFLCYQPVIGAESEDLVGAEALLRWEKEPFGLVPPGLFIPWLENDPSFFDLGNWILERAMTESKGILEKYPNFVLNVNIAFPQLARIRFRQSIKEILDRTGFPPKNLCLELTERCRQLEVSYLREEIDYLKSLDIKIAMDDFGTGFSSLNLLKDLPVDTLKIDRGFVCDIQGNVANQEIVRAISSCASNLDIHICMEGLEDRNMVDYMSRFSPYSYQGFYYSRPIPMNDFYDKYMK
jgi:diguanylate cyclase (GGDEF)-like protein